MPVRPAEGGAGLRCSVIHVDAFIDRSAPGPAVEDILGPGRGGQEQAQPGQGGQPDDAGHHWASFLRRDMGRGEKSKVVSSAGGIRSAGMGCPIR